MSRNLLSPEQRVEVRRLYFRENKTHREIAAQFKVSTTTIGSTINPRPDRRKYKTRSGTLDRQMPVEPTPNNTIAERNYRLGLKPRDLTASLMGDPPKGYSALERGEHGEP